MSNLTKVLIVLLTISSIFLCGIVVTYVANADNYRQKYDNLRNDRDAAQRKQRTALTKPVERKDPAKRRPREIAEQPYCHR